MNRPCSSLARFAAVLAFLTAWPALSFGDSPCDRLPIHGKFTEEACLTSTDALERFYDQCVRPQKLMSSDNLFASITRLAQMKFLIQRDALLLKRIAPTHPEYERMWRDFEEEWNTAYGKDTAVYQADFSYAIDPKKRGGLEADVLGIRNLKAAARAEYIAGKGRDPRPLDTGYDLLRASLALYALHTPYVRKLRENQGPDAQYIRDDLDTLEDLSYRFYPELKIDPQFAFQAEAIFFVWAKINPSQVARTLFSGLEQGHPLEIPAILRALDHVIEEKIAPSADARAQVASLETELIKKMRGFRYAMLRSIDEGRSDADALYSHASLPLFASTQLDPAAGDWYPSVLGSIYCAKTLGYKKWKERWEEARKWTADGTAIAMAALILASWVAKKPLAEPGMVRTLSLTTLRISFGLGTTVAAGDYVAHSIEYERALDDFYWRLVKPLELKEAEEAKAKSAQYAGLLIFSMGAGVAAARLEPLIQAAKPLSIGGVSMSAAAIGRGLTAAQLAVLGTFAWMDIKTHNWLGLTFQVLGLRLPYVLSQTAP